MKHEIDVKKDKYQMSKFQSTDIDVITVYRSTDNSQIGIVAFLKDLNEILDPKKRTAILGDFNISFPDNPISRELMAGMGLQAVGRISKPHRREHY